MIVWHLVVKNLIRIASELCLSYCIFDKSARELSRERFIITPLRKISYYENDV